MAPPRVQEATGDDAAVDHVASPVLEPGQGLASTDLPDGPPLATPTQEPHEELAGRELEHRGPALDLLLRQAIDVNAA